MNEWRVFWRFGFLFFRFVSRIVPYSKEDHRSFDMVDWIERVRGYRSRFQKLRRKLLVKMFIGVICAAVFWYFAGRGLFHWLGTDVGRCRYFAVKEALAYAEQYDLGRYFVTDKVIFDGVKIDYVKLHYEKITILLNHLGNLNAKHEEMIWLSRDIAKMNIVIAFMPVLLDVSCSSNILTIVNAFVSQMILAEEHSMLVFLSYLTSVLIGVCILTVHFVSALWDFKTTGRENLPLFEINKKSD